MPFCIIGNSAANAISFAYDLILAIKSITLSGGQKQRVSIARAVYLHTDLLVFDNVLSGLDTDTEEKVPMFRYSPYRCKQLLTDDTSPTLTSTAATCKTLR